MTDLDSIRTIHILGRELLFACMGGAPDTTRGMLASRMQKPRVGDLVIEVTSFGPHDPDQVGWLRAIERDELGTPVERWIVEPLHRPGHEQGWRNAEFIAVPTDRARTWCASESP